MFVLFIRLVVMLATDGVTSSELRCKMWKKRKKICGCAPCTENDLAQAIGLLNMKHLIEPVSCWLWFVNSHYCVYFGERYEFIYVVDIIKITMFPSFASLQ